MSTAKMYHGKKVIDAHLPITMTVKEDDVKGAKRKDPAQCAIARCAIRDKHVISARIGQRIALIEYGSHFERYKVSRGASNAIREFDKNGTFADGQYYLIPIPKSLSLTGKAHSLGRGGNEPSVIKCKATRNIYKAKECIAP